MSRTVRMRIGISIFVVGVLSASCTPQSRTNNDVQEKNNSPSLPYEVLYETDSIDEGRLIDTNRVVVAHAKVIKRLNYLLSDTWKAIVLVDSEKSVLYDSLMFTKDGKLYVQNKSHKSLVGSYFLYGSSVVSKQYDYISFALRVDFHDNEKLKQTYSVDYFSRNHVDMVSIKTDMQTVRIKLYRNIPAQAEQ